MASIGTQRHTLPKAALLLALLMALCLWGCSDAPKASEAEAPTAAPTDTPRPSPTPRSTPLVLPAMEPLEIEAQAEALIPADLGLGDDGWVEPFVPDTPGDYRIRISVRGREGSLPVRVVDTTPPALILRTLGEVYVEHPLTPADLFDAFDVTGVTLAFVNEPDWSRAGEQEIGVWAEDGCGNRAEGSVTLTLLEDTEPPVIYGVKDRYVYKDEPVVYFAEAFALDNADGRVTMTVESLVDLHTPGKYAVTYIATDKCGNTASQSCTFHVVEAKVTEEEVRVLAGEVIARIITPDMVKAEQLNAVFNYVRSRVKYTGSSDKTDWRSEAIRGFTKGRGDCFTVYSVTRALLDELHIDYMSMTRRGGRTRHYWVIVNIGTGWYHFDPLVTSRHKHRCFMWTNKQCAVKAYFWRFDHSKYPEIATEPFDYAAVVAAEKAGLLP